MGSTVSNEVSMSVDEVAESSDTTVEIKIKTLDSQTYTLQVNKRVPVPALKEQIATVTGVLSEQQRLICRGKVLKDDELLSAYHVEDGHTLHLVVRQPIPSSASGDTVGPDGSSDYAAQNSPPSSNVNQRHPVARAIVFQAVNTGQGENTTPYLDRFFPSLFSSLAPELVETGNEMDLDHLTRTSAEPAPADSARALRRLAAMLEIVQQRSASLFPPAEPVPADSARALPPRVSSMLEIGQQRAASQFPSASNLVFQNPAEIPDSMTTINQYIGLMRDLLREDFRDNGHQYSTGEVSGMTVNEGHGGDSQSHPAPGHNGLPSTAHLAEILGSTRQLLIEDVASFLAQLARQLDDQATVAEPLIRANIQRSARRSATILQNFGSLLLELGRTTMTLHMGQTPSEALVSAGPAIYISASGPNPLMVQHSLFRPGPTLGGVNMASANSSDGFQGYAVPASNANLGELAGGQRAHVPTDTVGNVPGSAFLAHALSRASGNVPLTGESGIPVVPARQAVAIHAGDRIGVQLPVLARTQHPYPVQNAENTHASIEPRTGSYDVDQQPISDGNQLPTNSLPVASDLGSLANESHRPQESARVFIRSRQRSPVDNGDDNAQAHDGQQSWERHVPRLARREEARRREELNGNGIGRQVPVTISRDPRRRTVNGDAQGTQQAIYFSNMVRQLMPYISEDTTTESEDTPTESSVSLADRIRSSSRTFFQNSTGSSSSQQHRDPSEAPDPKRPKMDQ